MASLAQDNSFTGSAAKAPISVHPAFPFVVALWFAALLGLGSLVVPVALIEQVVTATGIASAVPAAAPPLGVTARCLIALFCTFSGAVAGLLIARQVASAHRREHSTPRIPAFGRKPISAHAELGAEGLGEPGNRRRALAIADEDAPSEFFDHAPLPGLRASLPGAGDQDDVPPIRFDPARVEPGSGQAHVPLALDELELGDFAEDHDEEYEPEPDFDSERVEPRQFLASGAAQAFEDVFEDEDMSDRQDFSMPGDDYLPAGTDHGAQDAHPQAEHEPVASAAKLPESANDADTRNENAMIEDDRQFDAGSEEILSTSDDPETATAQDAEPAAEPRARHWEASPLDDLGLVQLAQRLGSSIERRRELRSARAQALASAATPTPRPIPAGFDVAAPEDAAQAMAAYFGRMDGAASAADTVSHAAAPAVSDAFQHDHPAADEGQLEVAETDTGTAKPFAAFNSTCREDDAPDTRERQVFQPVEDQVDRSAYKPFSGFTKLPEGGGSDEDDEDEDLDDLAASFSLPLNRTVRHQNVPQPEAQEAPGETPRQVFRPVEAVADQGTHELAAMAAESEADEDSDEDGDDAEFGSLLALRNPFREQGEEFVRIEDEPQDHSGIVEPAVIFPAEEAPRLRTKPVAAPANASTRPFDRPHEGAAAPSPRLDPEENERALREALLNLQRMSGTA